MSQEIAHFAAGCFWGIQARFQKLPGVIATQAGYMGGSKDAHSYEDVCSGATGHAEAVEIIFDPDKISYAKLLQTFWTSHDPTTLNRQGPDIGTQYRSAIFCHGEDQLTQAQASKQALQKQGVAVVTDIIPAPKFFAAEDYHQNYLQKRSQMTGA